MEVSGIGNIAGVGSLKQVENIKSQFKPESINSITEEKNDFVNSIKKGLESVQKIQNEADEKIKSAITEGGSDPTEAIISMVKAEISMQLTLQIRNKLIEAYNEITRMSI